MYILLAHPTMLVEAEQIAEYTAMAIFSACQWLSLTWRLVYYILVLAKVVVIAWSICSSSNGTR